MLSAAGQQYRRERLADPHEPCDKLQRDLHRQRFQARAHRRLELARCSGIGGRGGGAVREEECKPAPVTPTYQMSGLQRGAALSTDGRMGSAACAADRRRSEGEGYRAHRARARFFVRSSCSAADRTCARPSAVARLAPMMCVSDATAATSAPATRRVQPIGQGVVVWRLFRAQRRSGRTRSFDRICFGPVGTLSALRLCEAHAWVSGGLSRLFTSSANGCKSGATWSANVRQ